MNNIKKEIIQWFWKTKDISGLANSKEAGIVYLRRILRRFLWGIIITPSLLLLPNAAMAVEINIPWTVDLFVPAGTDPMVADVPPFDTTYTGVEVATPSPIIDTFGFDFTSTHEHSYSIHLPFEINISAPDQVSPGQFVTLESSAVLAGTPSFSTVSNVDFDTSVFTTAGPIRLSESFASHGLLGEIDTWGFNGTAAGSASYSDTDTSADERLTRTIWQNDVVGGEPLQLVRGELFEGYELQTTGDMDAWQAGIDVLATVGHFFPPAAIGSIFSDIQVDYGLDIIEETTLTTQFVSGFYTDDGGATYDDFLINGATRQGWLTIPDTLSAGDTYEIQMSALGLGFTTLFEYFLQGNIDIDLELLLGLVDEDLGEIPFSTFLVDSWADRFQFVDFMNPAYGGFLTEEQFANAILSFDIIDGLSDLDPTLTAPPWEAARVDPYIGDLIDSDADQGQQSYEFPGDPPTATVVVAASVPEPTSLVLLGLGLAGISFSRRKKV